MGKWTDLAVKKKEGKWSSLAKTTQRTGNLASSGGYWDEMVAVPEADVAFPNKGVEPVIRPILEYGGLTAGAMAATPSGPAGQVLGAGLGYGIGKEAANLLFGEKQGALPQELQESAQDVVSGMMMEMGGQVFGKLAGTYGMRGARKIEKAISTGLKKAIRIPARLAKNASMRNRYLVRARQAVGAIVSNKDRLKLGEFAESRLPQTLEEFEDAIKQVKQIVFDEYDQLQKIAGTKGVEVDVTPAIKELKNLLSDRVLHNYNPAAVKYGSMRLEQLSTGSLSPSEAQRLIRLLNQSSKRYWKDPGALNWSNMHIDELIANNIRKSLNEAIEASGEYGYQELRNIHGALLHIERDVSRAAVVRGRRSPVGLLDMTDIFTGQQALTGLLRGDPVTVAGAAGAKSVQTWYKFKSDPNKIVKRLFEDVEKVITASTIKPKPQAAELVGRTVGYALEGED